MRKIQLNHGVCLHIENTNKFKDVNDELTSMQLFNQRCFAVMNPMMTLVHHALVLGIYIIGAILITNAGMSDKVTLFSNMVVFSSYGMHVIMSFLVLSFIFMMLTSLSRISFTVFA